MTGPAQPANAPLRWKRVLVIAVVVATILFAIAWAPLAFRRYEDYRERKAAEPHPIPASDAQQLAIMRAILTMERSLLRPPPPPATAGSASKIPPAREIDPPDRLPVGIIDHTLSLRSCDPSRPSGATRCDMGGHVGESIEGANYESSFPLTWRRELVAASLTSTRLVDPRVDGAELVAGESESTDGLAGFSRAVLSRDGRAALVYFEMHGPGFGAACIVYKLVRTPSGWQVEEQQWYCVG